MSESNALGSFELDAIVESARDLWRDASGRAPHAPVELYAKVAERVRVERGRPSGAPALRRGMEAGLAIRVLTPDPEGAGFAAASGFSFDTARWVLGRALARDRLATGDSPDATGVDRSESRDVDSPQALPTGEELLALLEEASSIEWIEAGRTVEVLLGRGGWLTVRLRQRVWGLVQGDTTSLIARRNLMDWRSARIETGISTTLSAAGVLSSSQSATFLPDAASPIVLALVGMFHLSESWVDFGGGRGWSVDDDPLHAAGLSGGTFDDAGFKAEPRALAKEGLSVGRIFGPGTLRRRSFRDPPVPGPSNLTMPPGSGAPHLSSGVVVDRCRVIRLGNDLWVLELELRPFSGRSRRRAYARLSPAELLGCCAARIGTPRVTADGPIVPALVFDRLPLEIST